MAKRKKKKKSKNNKNDIAVVVLITFSILFTILMLTGSRIYWRRYKCSFWWTIWIYKIYNSNWYIFFSN